MPAVLLGEAEPKTEEPSKVRVSVCNRSRLFGMSENFTQISPSWIRWAEEESTHLHQLAVLDAPLSFAVHHDSCLFAPLDMFSSISSVLPRA